MGMGTGSRGVEVFAQRLMSESHCFLGGRLAGKTLDKVRRCAIPER
jgi:hypothetical protein